MLFKKNTITKRPSTVEKFNEPKEYHEQNRVFTIAFIIDGKVQEIVRTEERFMSILTSNPVIVDITENESRPSIGWLYNEELEEFTKNEEIQEDKDTASSDI